MNKVKIYYILLQDLEKNEGKIRRYLKEDDIAAAERHRLRANMLLSLGSSYLKRRFAGDKINISPFGKPMAEGIFFSVSHCKEIVGIAISRVDEVGLDIESNLKACEEIAERFFTEEERNGEYSLLDIFTSKESLSKAEGSGLREGLIKIPALPLRGKVIYKDETYYRRCFSLPPYSVSVTQKGRNFRVEEEYIKEF